MSENKNASRTCLAHRGKFRVAIAAMCAVPLLDAVASNTRANPIVFTLESKVLEVGEVVDGTITVTNIGQPDEHPKAVVPEEGLRMELLGAPSRSSHTSIINGKVTSKDQYIYRVQVTAVAPGSYVLGPVSVTVEGKSYATVPVRINVREPTVDNTQRGDRLIFVELSAEPTSLFVTEQLTATLTIGIRQVLDRRGNPIPMDLLREVIDLRRSQLSVFRDAQVRQSDMSITDSQGMRHRYSVYHATKSMRMDEVGTVTIGPIFLRGNYPTGVRRGFFGAYEATTTQRQSARAEAIEIRVEGPPLEGRPEDYSGAIGHYKLSVSAKPDRVEQGQPVTLTITIQGSPIEGVAGPDLSRNAELVSRFEFTPDELVGDVSGHRKVFRRAVFPRQQGAQSIPPIRWSYFDPDGRKYVTLESEPTPITVDPAPQGTAPVAIEGMDAGDSDGTKLTVLTGGISPNYADPEALLAMQSLQMTGGWIAAVTVPPLSWAVVALWVHQRRRLRTDGAYARRRRARQRAVQALNNAVSNGKHDEQWSLLAGAMRNYLGDRFNRPPGEITPEEVRAMLTAHGADERDAHQVAELLDSCNTARFAPSATDASSTEETAKTMKRWIQHIEKNTK